MYPYEDTSVVSIAPIHEAPVRSPCRRGLAQGPQVFLMVKSPELLAGGGVKGKHDQLRIAPIKHAIDDQRIALDRATTGIVWLAGIKGPGDLQFTNVLRRDLAQFRILAGSLVSQVSGPVDILGLFLAASYNEEKQCEWYEWVGTVNFQGK